MAGEEVRLTFAGPADAAPPPAEQIARAPLAAASPAKNQDTVSPPPATAPAAPVVLPDGLIVDARGRRLKLRELTLLQELDLMAVAGDNRASNRIWWVHVYNAAKVAEIDGIPMPFPTSDQEMRAMIARVEADGVAAVLAHLNPVAGQTGEESEEAQAKN